MRQLLRVACVLLGSLAIVPSTVYAQASIAGVVRDASGAVLPGVTVEAASPALLEKIRTAITDGTGQYKIEALRPGAYTVTFELAGFSTVKREGVELTGTFTAQINADLRVGELNETITVTGETPIVDVQNTKQQYVINQELMRTLPSSGNLQSIASLLPSVVRGTVDVGGLLGESGSTTGSLTSHGNADVRTEVGGISVHATQGSGTNNLGNGAAYQEMQVDTSGVSAEQKEGGIRINMVPRDGGNTFQFHFITAFANESTQGNNITQDLTDRGFIAPNSLKKYVEINPSGGGPIMRDRIWFYGTYRYNTAAANAPIHFNANAGNPNLWTYAPDIARGVAADENRWRSTNQRVAFQVTSKHKVGVAYDYASSCPCPRGLTATLSPEANADGYAPIKPGAMLFLDWTAPLTNRLLLEAGFMKRDSQSSRPRVNPFYAPLPNGAKMIQVTEQSTGLVYRGTSGTSTSSRNPTRQPRMSLSYITGAHALKVGFNLAWQSQNQKVFTIDSPLAFRFNNGVPNQLQLNATPWETFIDERDNGAFVQDRWTVKRITVTAGLRFDYFTVAFPEQLVGPGLFAPTRNFNFPESFGPTWKDLEPRSGLAWDLFGNGRTALKFSANKYLAFFGAPNASSTFSTASAFTSNMNPISRLVNTTTRSWTDTNRNFVPDCDLLNPAAQTVAGGDVCGAMADPAFGTSRPGQSYDPDTLSGWNKRPDSNWQFSAGVSHQLMPRVSVDVTYFRTIFTNAVVQDDLAVGPSDYDTFSIPAPRDSRLPDGGGYAISGLTNLKPASFGRVSNQYITFADKFGKTTNHWNGADVTFVVRPRSGLMVQGGASTGRTSRNNCALNQPLPEFVGVSGAAVANGTSFCDQVGAWLTQVKIISAYTVPKIDVQVSGTIQSVPGPQVTASYTATNAIVQPSLGRPLSGGAANVSVGLIQPGVTYGERMNELDLRLTKTLTFGKTKTNVGVDVYNVLNGNAVLTQSNSFANWQTPTRILGPRFARFVLTFDF